MTKEGDHPSFDIKKFLIHNTQFSIYLILFKETKVYMYTYIKKGELRTYNLLWVKMLQCYYVNFISYNIIIYFIFYNTST